MACIMIFFQSHTIPHFFIKSTQRQNLNEINFKNIYFISELFLFSAFPQHFSPAKKGVQKWYFEANLIRT